MFGYNLFCYKHFPLCLIYTKFELSRI